MDILKPITEHHTVIRPTMVPTLKEPGNHGTEVIMVPTNFNPDPGPGPDPEPIRKDLAVTSAAEWAFDNNYTTGETIKAFVALYEGGTEEEVVYRYRWQTKDPGDSDWTNGKWINYVNVDTTIEYTLAAAGTLRFQCQARDASVDPADQVNSFTSTQTVSDPPPPPPPPTTIGDITAKVDDQDYDLEVAPALTLLLDDPIAVALTISGDANPTYTWKSRNDYPFTASEQAATTELTLHQEGMASITCDIADPTATDGTQSIVINFYVVDAKTWEELRNKEENES